MAAQREELLQRLGGTGQAASASRVREASAELAASSEVSRKSVPKPGASRAADQFRKLRRDAKRKAIGV